MSNIVTWAKLHAPLFIPRDGGLAGMNLKDTLPPDNKTLKNFKMTLQEGGSLILSWEEGKYTRRYMVGAANVAGAMLESVVTAVSTENTSV